MYGVYRLPSWLPGLLQNPYILFIILLKLCFAGFFIGQFIHLKSLARKHAKLRVIYLISAITLLGIAINVVNLPSLLQVIPVVVFLTFVPALLYGVLFGEVVRATKHSHNKTLFILLLGSAISVFLYTYTISYLSFVPSLVAAALLPHVLLAGHTTKRVASVILFGIVTATGLMLVPKVYTYPDFGERSFVPVRTVFTPHGVTDILHNPKNDTYQLLSDKASITTIAKRDDINNIQHHTQIPYLLKPYEHALLIGIGGGQDAVAALYHKTKNVTVVDIDATRIQLMQTYFRDYSHNLFGDPRITTVTDSARSYLRKNDQTFDLITIQRPWTEKIMNSFLYDTSAELFTREALQTYLDHLTEDGILYWAVPYTPGWEHERTLLPIRNALPQIHKRLLIFSPYPENPYFISILIGKSENLDGFYRAFKDTYQFHYYPGISDNRNDEITHYVLSKANPDSQATDTQIYGQLNRRTLTRTLLSIALVLFVTSFIVSGFAFRKNNAVPLTRLLYIYLGLGYEIVLLVLILSASRFVSNLYQFLPVAYISAYTIGSIGYLHSEKLKSIFVSVLSLLLSGIFLVLVFSGIVTPGAELTLLQTLIHIVLFVLVSFLLTFPFGHLLSHERSIRTPLLIDYAGSFLYLPLLLLLPNMEYLLIFSAIMYSQIGLMLLVCSRIKHPRP